MSDLRNLSVTADFLRTDTVGWPEVRNHGLRVCRVLQSLQRGRGHPDPELIDWDLRLDCRVHGGRILIENGVAQTADGWAAIYERQILRGATWRFLANELIDSVVIGFEMAPVIKSALSEYGIAWVDLCPSSLRFVTQRTLFCETNAPEIDGWLARSAFPGATVWSAAARRIATTNRVELWNPKLGRKVPNGSEIGVLCLQVPRDRSRIAGGKFASIADYEVELKAWASRFETVVIKPHPLGQDSEEVWMATALPNAISFDGNIYDLLASYKGSVCALSSSVLEECRYFSWEADPLIGSIFDRSHAFTRGLGYHLVAEDAVFDMTFLEALSV